MRRLLLSTFFAALSLICFGNAAGAVEFSKVVEKDAADFVFLPKMTYGQIQDCSLATGLMYNTYNAKLGASDEVTISAQLSYLWWNKALSHAAFLDNPGPNYHTRSSVMFMILDDTKSQKQRLKETGEIGGKCLELYTEARKKAGRIK